MSKRLKIRLVSWIIFLSFLITVCWCFYCGSVLHLGYPYNTFLAPTKYIFSDFLDMMPLIENLEIYNRVNEWLNYCPFSYLILYPFSLIRPHEIGYILFVALFLLFYLRINIKFLECQENTKLENFFNIFSICVLSYPFLFLLNRGNTDMLVFPFFAGFIICLRRAYNFSGRVSNRYYFIGSIFLTVLCAMKPYFLSFLLLYLKNKRVKELVMCILGVILLNLLALIIFRGGILEQFYVFLQNMSGVKAQYLELETHYGLGFSSSILGALRGFLYFVFSIANLKTIASFYKFFSVILTLIVIYGVYKEKSFWKQITLLSLYSYCVPFMVYDYKLVFLLFPFWFFVNESQKSRFDILYSVLFALLFISKSFYIFDLRDGFNFISSNMLLNPIIMIVFIGLIICEQQNYLWSKKTS